MVVLPFINLGGDPEQEYFVDGVTESLTTDLSRISGSFVIARNTAFAFRLEGIAEPGGERALALEPENVEALVGTAWVNFAIVTHFLTDDRIEHLTAAEAAAMKALSLAPDHPLAHFFLGAVQTFTNRAAQGITKYERALVLNRNLAQAHANIGIAKLFLGWDGETQAHVEQALRLSHPRYTRLCLEFVYRSGQTLAGRRRRSDCLAAPEP
jgi:hypothetical protein